MLKSDLELKVKDLEEEVRRLTGIIERMSKSLPPSQPMTTPVTPYPWVNPWPNVPFSNVWYSNQHMTYEGHPMVLCDS